MKFEPAPPNPFSEFVDVYDRACREVCPKMVALAGKWTFEDLIPGLSDFDTRLLFRDDTTAADWSAASLAIGRIHTNLTRQRPDWRRILEHLPGVNVTCGELLDSVSSTPEMHLWTVYRGSADIPPKTVWTAADELFHLKKFATFYGPYQRGIDPPINLGSYENKYALHSRYMHYFAPPVQAAVAIVQRRSVRGKLASLKLAQKLFPDPEVIDRVLNAVENHYGIAADYQEHRLAEIEAELEQYLGAVLEGVAGSVSVIKLNLPSTREQLQEVVSRVSGCPAARVSEFLRFSRLMRGRLLFFAESIPWFETGWLIRNELRRIEPWFYQQALQSYGLAAFGEKLPADEVLDRVDTRVIPSSLASGYRQFSKVARQPVESGREKEAAHTVADVMEPVQVALEQLASDLRAHARGKVEAND